MTPQTPNFLERKKNSFARIKDNSLNLSDNSAPGLFLKRGAQSQAV